jgi:hypothetical protein
MSELRPIDQDEIGRRAFAELVFENTGDAVWREQTIWHRASDELKQDYFDRRIPRQEQEYIRALIERGPPS